jgi:gluconolactonase
LIATPDAVEIIAAGLDHSESLFITNEGRIFAGGEAGQIYEVDATSQSSRVIGSTSGNILGLALDGEDAIYACDYGRKGVFRVSQQGEVSLYSGGSPQRQMSLPNHPVFLPSGDLYVTDSGDYWAAEGTGCVFRIRPGGETEVFHAGPFRYPNGLALHPSGEWLYVALTSCSKILRIPVDQPNGDVEEAFVLPQGWLPDGMWFADDGRLVVGCYRPDQVICCHPGGEIEVLLSDPTAELLIAPTNIFLHSGRIYVANLGGYHITTMETDMNAGPIHRPLLSQLVPS